MTFIIIFEVFFSNFAFLLNKIYLLMRTHTKNKITFQISRGEGGLFK